MKKIFKFLAASMTALFLASCRQAKYPFMSESAFKKILDEKMEEHRVGDDLFDKNLSYKLVVRDVPQSKFSSEEYNLDTTNYGNLKKTPTENMEISITYATVDSGIISYDDETGYVETGLKATTKYSLGLYDDALGHDKDYVSNGELRFMYCKSVTTQSFNAKKEIVSTTTIEVLVDSGIVYDTTVSDEAVAFIGTFVIRDGAKELINSLKGVYNGYLDEIASTLADANIKKEIVEGGTNYIYRYLDNSGYHEFQISNSTYAIERSGFRADMNIQVASAVQLSGF